MKRVVAHSFLMYNLSDSLTEAGLIAIMKRVYETDHPLKSRSFDYSADVKRDCEAGFNVKRVFMRSRFVKRVCEAAQNIN